MNQPLDATLLGELSELICARTGLIFAADRWAELRRGIGQVAREFGFEGFTTCARWLLTAPLTQTHIAILAAELTVGETYFFREAKAFAILRQRILPQLLEERRRGERRLRIWCAGCCTGEEAYSLAILLEQAIPDLPQWDVSILATDINPRFLYHARQGLFGEWSFRGVAPDLKERYFTQPSPGRYEILPQLRERISFSQLNLADDIYPSPLNGTQGMDIIFCRNVMIYMSPSQVKGIVQRLGRSLADSGCLIVGAAESSQVLNQELACALIDGVTVYSRAQTKWPIEPPAPLVLPPAALPQWETPTPAFQILPEIELAPPPQCEVVPAPQAQETTPDSLNSADVAQLSRVSADQGNLEAARQWCDQAVQADKLNSAWHYLRGTILEAMGQWPEAVAAYRRALYLEPDFVMGHVSLTFLLQTGGKARESHRHRKSALSLLQRQPADEIVPESGGLTAARLGQMLLAAGIEEEIFQ